MTSSLGLAHAGVSEHLDPHAPSFLGTGALIHPRRLQLFLKKCNLSQFNHRLSTMFLPRLRGPRRAHPGARGLMVGRSPAEAGEFPPTNGAREI